MINNDWDPGINVSELPQPLTGSFVNLSPNGGATKEVAKSNFANIANKVVKKDLKASELSESNSLGTLAALPNEILELVFNQLPIKKVLNAESVSIGFQNIVAGQRNSRKKEINELTALHLISSMRTLMRDDRFNDFDMCNYGIHNIGVIIEDDKIIAVQGPGSVYYFVKKTDGKFHPQCYLSYNLKRGQHHFLKLPELFDSTIKEAKMVLAYGSKKTEIIDEIVRVANNFYKGASKIAERDKVHFRFSTNPAWIAVMLDDKYTDKQILEAAKTA